jgi:2-succinyl-5-enolpyruvyl-6-hydroxy-3-cyclohexene-1-carboxylate synthase
VITKMQQEAFGGVAGAPVIAAAVVGMELLIVDGARPRHLGNLGAGQATDSRLFGSSSW